jgi:transposase-like protein
MSNLQNSDAESASDHPQPAPSPNRVGAPSQSDGPANPAEFPDQARPIVEVIRSIQQRSVDPKTLSKEDRILCVRYLLQEGVPISDIAAILKCDDRTVYRYQKLVRQQTALQHDPKFDGELAGQMVEECQASIARLTRIARDKDASRADKIAAELGISNVRDTMVRRLQSMGFISQTAHQISAHITHEVSEPPPLETVALELRRLTEIACQIGLNDPELSNELRRLNADTVRAELAERTTNLARQLPRPIDPPISPGSSKSNSHEEAADG